MARALRNAGSATLETRLRGQKRTFALPGTEMAVSTSCREKKTMRRKSTSKITSFVGNSVVDFVAPLRASAPSFVLPSCDQDVCSPSCNSVDSQVLLQYPNLVPARLLRRYKRFLADVVLVQETGTDKCAAEAPPGKKLVNTSGTGDEEDVSVDEVVTVYCPNTGPMVGLLDELPNARVQLSKSGNPKRKYAYTLEMIQIHNGDRNVWVGVHSSSANCMVEQALTSRWFTELGPYDSVRREVKFAKGSRVDFVLVTNAEDGSVAHEKYVEVKSVTLSVGGCGQASSRCAVFPDTVSTRAQKHVVELTELLSTNSKIQVEQESKRATPERSGAIIFLVQRDDCHAFAPSIKHDRKFAELCMTAASSGVQLLAYACALEPDELNGSGAVRLLKALPLHDGAILDRMLS
uniref:Sugar fermentation stimulation protein n=1 Tax=Peronospora matthiolae TaxID=2874970 RepID=A0AAV1UQH2_9STRA